MRVAVIVVTMLVVVTPSETSQSCMSKAEALQHFPSVHIYWYGRDPHPQMQLRILDQCWVSPGLARELRRQKSPPLRDRHRGHPRVRAPSATGLCRLLSLMQRPTGLSIRSFQMAPSREGARRTREAAVSTQSSCRGPSGSKFLLQTATKLFVFDDIPLR
jgi:hypothetical protein